ncbi:MAG TPA: phosphotransferase [Myxococcota bacterium]|nr:phosphotransferase [Myxococcota bacterium]
MGESLRERAQREHPDFPWLDPARPDGVGAWLASAGWLDPGERFLGCERAGEGNMNLTLRVRTDRRRFVLKQARPWVEKYDGIAAPWERSLVEQRFYQFVAELPEVASRMPRLLAADPAAKILMLEDLPGARDLSAVYAGGAAPTAAELEELAAYLGALHAGSAGRSDRTLANRAMRELNHEHLFVVPLDPENGMTLDAFEPGLEAAAHELARDPAVRAAVAAAARRYLADGPCLVHGDFFPGSWLRTDAGIRVIDPEFGFYGDPELDVGVALAHLALAELPSELAGRFLDAYRKGRAARPLDAGWVARFAGVEVVRRLAGVAQLPIPNSRDRRVPLLRRAGRALVAGDVLALWSAP